MRGGSESFDLDSKPRIDPTVVPVALSPDEVHVRAGPWSGPIVTFSDEDREGKLADIIGRLDGTQTFGEIIEAFDDADAATIRHIVGELADKNVVFDARESAAEPDTNRSPLPLRFSRPDLDGLAATSVLVVSDGAIGRHLTSMLADAGVGEIGVRYRDRATVDESSSARPFDPTADALREDVQAADVVVAAVSSPWPTALERTNVLAQETDTPLVVAEAVGYDVSIGPTVLPGETACYECYRRRRNANVEAPDGYEAFERAAKPSGESVVDRLPFAQLVAGFLTIDVVNQLCYGYGYTVGRTLVYDMASLSFEANHVLRMPRCSVCGPDAELGTDALFAVDGLREQSTDESDGDRRDVL